MYSVYKITNLDTGVFYYGRTNNFERRKLNHLSTLRNNKHTNSFLQDSFNISNNLSWDRLDVKTLAEASTLEAQLITDNKNNQLLANFHNAKTSQKVLDVYTPEYIEKMSTRSTGRMHSEETKAKMSASSKRTKPSLENLAKAAETNRKCIQVDGVQYRTALEAADFFGVHITTVLNRARNPNEKWSGWSIVEKGGVA